MPSTCEVPSTLLPDSVVAPSHADPVVAHDHAPTQFDEELAVDTQFDDPFQFDDPQSKPVYDHRDDLPHHIRTQLQSRIHKPAQNLEPDAKRLRLDAGKRAVLMLSHDVSSGPECCKPVTVFKSCENSGCADVLLTRRAANKEVQYDALVKSQNHATLSNCVGRSVVCIPNMSTFRAFRSFVCLSVFACTPVHSNSLTTSTDSLARIAGALTKQLSVLPLSKHVSHTCLTSSSSTRVFHNQDLERVPRRCPLRLQRLEDLDLQVSALAPPKPL